MTTLVLTKEVIALRGSLRLVHQLAAYALDHSEDIDTNPHGTARYLRSFLQRIKDEAKQARPLSEGESHE